MSFLDSYDEGNFIEQYSVIEMKCFVTVSSVLLTVDTKFLYQITEKCDCTIDKEPSLRK